MQRIIAIASAVVLTGIGATAFAGTDVKLEDLPEPVRKTVEREVKDGNITDIERETRNGKEMYEVEFTRAGKAWELDIAADGKVMSKRQD